MPPRYPALPVALLRLLEAGPLTGNGFQLEPRTYVWEGTSTSLYSTLEPHRVEPWPANPVSLSLWLKRHAREHGIQVEAWHTGKRRVLRLARGANGLGVGCVLQHCGTESPHSGAFWSFPTWAALLEALPALLEVGESYYTLSFDLVTSRISQTVPAPWLPLVAERWAAQSPQPREVRVYPGTVEVVTLWPLPPSGESF